MPKYPYGKQRIIDRLSFDLDEIEKNWQMAGGYERIDPYIIPFQKGREYFELIIYHVESKAWFDNFRNDFIMDSMSDYDLIIPGDVVFDLGSNSGAVSLLMAKLCGDNGHVHAFDPYPWNAVSTGYNAQLNYLSNSQHTSLAYQTETIKYKFDQTTVEFTKEVLTPTLNLSKSKP